MITTYEDAKNKLLTFSLDEECQSFFQKNNCILELAYSKIFTDNPKQAEDLFRQSCDLNPRSQWGVKLAGMLQTKPVPYPTYFELRNFLEIDLNLLINYGKSACADEVISYSDSFFSVNPEVYKYIGRVYWNNGVYSYGKFFLERAKSYFYPDPELHVLLANVYLAEGKPEKAITAVENCLEVLPEYYPAIVLKRKLTKN